MAYIPTYKTRFTDEQMNIVVITLSEKDGDAVSVTEFACSAARLSYNGDEGKFNPISGMTCEVELFIDVDETDPTPILVQAKKDTWLVTVTIDDKPFFSGYLLADEYGAPFQDLPYNIKITATDGIGLLKEVTMANSDFTAHHSIIAYVAYCLQQTGLSLPIRVKDYIYHSSFNDRADNTAADFFSQAYLEYRTFLKDATTFENCYDALEIIFKENYRLSQDNGEWKISRLGMLQHVPFVEYETLYDANGENPVGVEISENYATVGKKELIYPHGEDQIKYIKKAVKSSKATFNYDIWPELPRNNKFERGSQVSTGIALDDSDIDGDGNFTEVIGTRKSFAINDWSWGEFSLTDAPNFTMNTGPVEQPLINRIYNPFDLEIIREVSIPPSPNAGGGLIAGLKCENIPVVQGDRIKFGVDKRYSDDISSGDETFSLAAIVYLIPTGGGAPFYLINSFNEPQLDGIWATSFSLFSFVAGISVRFGDTDARKYASVTVESQPIPVTGDLRIILVNPTTGASIAYYRNFDLEYLPMVAGGFQKVKGDYNIITQNQDYIDKSEGQFLLSDNPHKVFKGCLLNSSGIPLSPSFYRMGVTESKAYKAIGNYARFNFEHRRMSMIEGSFTSLMYAPQNNQEFYYPVSLHKQYRFVDLAGQDKRFLLCSPVEMDLVKGYLTARFWEIYDDAHLYLDGHTNGTEEFKYIF